MFVLYQTWLIKKHTYSIQNSHFNRAHIHIINLIFYANTFSSTWVKIYSFHSPRNSKFDMVVLGYTVWPFGFTCDTRKLLVVAGSVEHLNNVSFASMPVNWTTLTSIELDRFNVTFRFWKTFLIEKGHSFERQVVLSYDIEPE